MVAEYRIVLSGSRQDLASSVMCSVYSIGEEYGEPGCPIFHPDKHDTPQKKRLAFLTMCGAYKEVGRMWDDHDGSDFKIVFPRPRLEGMTSYGQREPVIRARFSGSENGNQNLELEFSAHSRQVLDYLIDSVKEWTLGQRVEEQDFRW